MQTNLTFIQFIENRDPELFSQILTEAQYDEFFKDMSGRARRIIGGIGAALALGSASPKRMDVDLAPKPAIVRSVTSPVIQSIIDHIRKETGEIINPNDIKMIKPSEVISPEYGKDYEKVRDMSAKFQDSPQKIGDVDIPNLEIPRDLSAADMRIGELEKPIPVVFMDPNKFPRLEPGTRGFCTTVLGGQKFCVVDSPSNLSTLRHELSHSTQDMLFQSSLSDENPSIKYLTNNAEIGVRLGELKRNWYKQTGEILTRENFGEALKDLMRNPQKYSRDVQQLAHVYSYYYNNDKSKLHEFIRFMADHIDAVVRNDGGNQKSVRA
jgi:hypothetical protein